MKRDIRADARILLRHPYGWIGSGFGTGLSPVAPGTSGSAAAVLLFWLTGAAHWPWWANAIVVSAMFGIGVIASGWVCKALNQDDASSIVIDEWVGQWMTLATAALCWPSLHGWSFVWMLLSAFALFRWADILKPWPARNIDRELGGGLGAMLDDAIAGVYSSLAVATVAWIATRAA